MITKEDEAGNILNIGRRSRIIIVEMSRALSAHDHHRELHKGNFSLSVKRYSSVSKGEISRFAERLVSSLCREGLRGRHFAEGESVIEANPVFKTCSSVELLWSIYRDIGIKTAITRWLGERMDLEMSVDGLLYKTYRH